MYDQHKRGMATTRHRSLVGRDSRKVFVRDKGPAHQKNDSTTILSNIKKIRTNSTSSKANRLFLIELKKQHQSIYKYVRASPADLPFGSRYLTGTKYFLPISLVGWKWKSQQGWVIKPVRHNLVRRIDSWSIGSKTRFFIFVLNDEWNKFLKSGNRAENIHYWLGRAGTCGQVCMGETRW